MIPINNQQTADNSNNPQSKLTNVKNQKKPDGSGILKRNKNENQDQDELIPTVKKIKKEDFGVENSTSVGMSGGRKWMLRTDLQSRGIPKPSVSSPNYSSSALFPPLQTTDSHSSPLSVEMALEFLNIPISNEDDMNAEGIVREIRDWLSLSRCSQELFLSHILDVDKRRFDYVIAFPQEYFSLASGRKLFAREVTRLVLLLSTVFSVITLVHPFVVAWLCFAILLAFLVVEQALEAAPLVHGDGSSLVRLWDCWTEIGVVILFAE
ncbi:hypothetical protein GCK72_012928 [Caenorhabditis remanei]|uniref:Uncharacterized protein n=1 Tax=Caenorhabditis remanei TaxID=31234 RepID=A0A6A5GPP5_CAERE|nr:hypothetical protein GCK72_012928 [Caenorhabditis remanei]KAF1756475.1 hypothetical protein GCK72_012928 [Caenorhabditis remanei]